VNRDPQGYTAGATHMVTIDEDYQVLSGHARLEGYRNTPGPWRMPAVMIYKDGRMQVIEIVQENQAP
jgi:hypothetical protein